MKKMSKAIALFSSFVMMISTSAVTVSASENVCFGNVSASEASANSKKSTLDAPTDFKATSTQTNITLYWNEVSGADKYRVFKYDSSEKRFKKYKDTTETSCKITGLTSNTSYKFKVSALDIENGKIVNEAVSRNFSVRTKKKVSSGSAPDPDQEPNEWKEPVRRNGISGSRDKILKECGIGNYSATVNSYIYGSGKYELYDGEVYFKGEKANISIEFDQDSGQLIDFTIIAPMSYSDFLNFLKSEQKIEGAYNEYDGIYYWNSYKKNNEYKIQISYNDNDNTVTYFKQYTTIYV